MWTYTCYFLTFYLHWYFFLQFLNNRYIGHNNLKVKSSSAWRKCCISFFLKYIRNYYIKHLTFLEVPFDGVLIYRLRLLIFSSSLNKKYFEFNVSYSYFTFYFVTITFITSLISICLCYFCLHFPWNKCHIMRCWFGGRV